MRSAAHIQTEPLAGGSIDKTFFLINEANNKWLVFLNANCLYCTKYLVFLKDTKTQHQFKLQ